MHLSNTTRLKNLTSENGDVGELGTQQQKCLPYRYNSYGCDYQLLLKGKKSHVNPKRRVPRHIIPDCVGWQATLSAAQRHEEKVSRKRISALVATGFMKGTDQLSRRKRRRQVGVSSLVLPFQGTDRTIVDGSLRSSQ